MGKYLKVIFGLLVVLCAVAGRDAGYDRRH